MPPRVRTFDVSEYFAPRTIDPRTGERQVRTETGVLEPTVCLLWPESGVEPTGLPCLPKSDRTLPPWPESASLAWNLDRWSPSSARTATALTTGTCH